MINRKWWLSLLCFLALGLACPAWAATETLRPTTPDITAQCIGSDGNQTDNWDMVNEASSDGDTTYVYASQSTGTADDVYNTTDSTVIYPWDTINSVAVTVVAKYSVANGKVVPLIRENGTTTAGSSNTLTSSYAEYTNTWTTRPSDGAAWTLDDINALGAGARLLGNSTWTARSTQVYVTVTYTAGTPPGGIIGPNIVSIAPPAIGASGVKVHATRGTPVTDMWFGKLIFERCAWGGFDKICPHRLFGIYQHSALLHVKPWGIEPLNDIKTTKQGREDRQHNVKGNRIKPRCALAGGFGRGRNWLLTRNRRRSDSSIHCRSRPRNASRDILVKYSRGLH